MIEDKIKKLILQNVSFYKKKCFPAIFTWEELERLLNLRPFCSPHRLETVSKKEKLREWPTRDWLSDTNTFPPDLVQRMVKENTCLFFDCSRVNKTINSICDELEQLTKRSVDAHIFFTVDKTKPSFNIHKDTSDNLIVQVDGSSNVKVWTEKYELRSKPKLDVVLNPGDAIYIPKQHWHQVIAKSKRLSVSFPISPTTNCQERLWITI